MEDNMENTLIVARQINELPLNIASIVVHVRPENMANLKLWLISQGGVEIHAENAQGKLVLVTESEHEKNILDLIDSIAAFPGTLNAALVYHEIISAQDLAADFTTDTPSAKLMEPTNQ